MASTNVHGSYVEIITNSNEEIFGYVYDLNEARKMLILRVRDTPTSLRPEFRVLNTDFVKDCKCVKKDQTIPIKGPSFVDIDAQKKKLQRATQNALKFEFDTLEKDALRSDRSGATTLGRRLFRELDKTLPCNWESDNSIRIKNIRIMPPYTDTSRIIADGNDKESRKTLQHIRNLVDDIFPTSTKPKSEPTREQHMNQSMDNQAGVYFVQQYQERQGPTLIHIISACLRVATHIISACLRVATHIISACLRVATHIISACLRVATCG
eukprot:gene1483-4641_t